MYDPLVDSSLNNFQGYPTSYWADKTHHRQRLEPLQKNIEAEIAIIGAGYTGLSTAYHLQRLFGTHSVVLEANDIGWGCSGRNAGFALPGSGRLSFGQLSEKFDHETALLFHQEFQDSVELVRDLALQNKFEIDLTEGGYLKLAHSEAQFEAMQKSINLLPVEHTQACQFLDKQTVVSSYLNQTNQFGGIFYPKAFGINPLKYALSLGEQVKQLGAAIYPNSPVQQWHKINGKHEFQTPAGTVKADKVIWCTNAYTNHRLFTDLTRKQFPVLSSVLVTDELTADQLEIFKRPGLLCMDTRPLKYYFRLLPDNRLLFGGRGAIKGKNHNDPTIVQGLMSALLDWLPQLEGLKHQYFWSGWVSVSWDDLPRISALDSDPSVFYSSGYCGSGIAFATLAGKRLAQLVAQPESLPDLPIYQEELKKFPFSAFRRLGLFGYYQWLRLVN